MVHTVEQIRETPSNYSMCLNCGNRAVWYEEKECPECGSEQLLQYGEVLNKTLLIESLEKCDHTELIVVR